MSTDYYYIYMITDQQHQQLYVGVTRDLHVRIQEHQMGLIRSSDVRQDLSKLVYFELFDDLSAAMRRKITLRSLPLAMQKKLVEKQNPRWHALASA
jgi:putative endonuclease